MFVELARHSSSRFSLVDCRARCTATRNSGPGPLRNINKVVSLRLVVGMVASIVLGCAAGGASGPIETGALEITVDSLPAGAEAAIAVSNTQGFNEVVTHSTTITGLVIGSYTVTASDVTVGSERFFAVAESQSVTVGSSSVTATVHVAYVLATPETTGALTVTVSGMSNGVAASVTVTGPSAFSQLLTATQTLSSLTPGSYTVTAAAVTSGATTYTPQPASQTVNVAAGATASASARNGHRRAMRAMGRTVSMRSSRVTCGEHSRDRTRPIATAATG